MAEAGGYAPLDTAAGDDVPSPRKRIEAAQATIAVNKAARAERLSPLPSATTDQTPRLAEEEDLVGELAPLVEDKEAAPDEPGAKNAGTSVPSARNPGPATSSTARPPASQWKRATAHGR